MFDSAKVTSTESDPAPAKQAATPEPGPAATTWAPAHRRPTTLEHAGERPVAAGDPEAFRRSRRPLGQRLAERPLLLDGAGPLRDRRPEVDDAAAATAPGASTFRLADQDGSPGRHSQHRGRRTQETLTIASVNSTTGEILTTTGATYAHGSGEDAEPDRDDRLLGLELPQDVCASGRVQSFGKGSRPLVAGSSSPFVSGLSPKGRPTSAATARPSSTARRSSPGSPRSAPTAGAAGRRRAIRGVTAGEKSHVCDLGAADARAGRLVLPRPRRQLLAAGHRPRDVVVGAGRPQGREAHLRGRQEVRTLAPAAKRPLQGLARAASAPADAALRQSSRA